MAVRPKGPREAPPKPRNCREFLEEWMPKLRHIESDAELDYSFRDDAITITDMRIPSKLRTGVLYTSREVEERADSVKGDFERRVQHFMSEAVGLR